MKKHEVELTSEERQTLETLVSKGEHNALEIRRAHILLKADVKGPAWRDAEIAEAFGCHVIMFANVLESEAVWLPCEEKTKSPVSVAETCSHWSDPPEGFSRWTLQRLADKLVELQVVESLSAEGVRQILKKTPYVIGSAPG